MVKILQKSLVIILTIVVLKSMAQPSCSFQHYSKEDGLPQFSILDILQDTKGFMWLATFDGLSKFDGYEFHNYKTQPGDPFPMKSNRIDRIHEGKYGRIWLEAYGGEIHCFDTKTEKFWGLTFLPETQENPFIASKIEIKPSGLVWLLSSNQGCICVTDSLYNTTNFTKENQKIFSNSVNTVFEDSESNTWILTNNGLLFLQKNKLDEGTSFFENLTENEEMNQKFVSVNELGNEIWFGSNNGCIERYSKVTKAFSSIDLSIASEVTYISKLTGNLVVISTSSDGFLTYNLQTKELIRYNSATVRGLKTNDLHVVHIKSPNQLWFATNEIGIYLYTFDSKKLTYFNVPTEEVSVPIIPASPFILEDNNKRLWVHPNGGGFSIYNEEKNTLDPFYNRPNAPDYKFSNVLHTAYFDRNNNLWFSSRTNGLEKITFNSTTFSSLQIPELDKSQNNYNTRALFEDEDGNIWVSIRGKNQIAIFNKKREMIGYLSPNGELKPDAVWTSTTYCIFCDASKNIWLGTRGDGLFKFSPKKEPLSFHVEHFVFNETDSYSLSDNSVYSIYQDQAQRIWIGTYGGGLNLIKNDNTSDKIKFINYRNDLRSYPNRECGKVRCVTGDAHGHICVGTTNGLLIFSDSFKSAGEIDYHHYTREAKNKNSLASNDVMDICITRDGEMFVGTFGGGINKVLTYDSKGFPDQFKIYSKKEELPSDLIQAIIEDQTGNLWISTQSELTRFNPATGHFENFSEAKRIISDFSFSEATKCITKSGELIFGFSNGVMVFNPANIKTNLYSPYLALTNFQLFNKQTPIGKDSPLKVAIDDCTNLTLTHKQNYFSIDYAALDFVNPAAIRYAYMLEGFDKEWNYVQKKRMASYTNIPKGDYILKVKSTNSEGVWGNNERRIAVHIKPSFWETPLAYTLYLLIFALVIFLIDYNLITIYRLKSDVKLEKKMSEMKLKFFTDISHEIRTPLTMITAPVDYLLNDHRTTEAVKKQLAFISQNTSRMLRLVNQILDFRKIQDMRLKVTEVELAPIVKDIFNDFSELAEEQGIVFTFQNQIENTKVWVNTDSLEKIVMNLLSNAFKFIANGKRIGITLLRDEKQITIKVFDDGPGIAKERMKNLFVRFASFSDDPSKPSTGIGLALVKELADKHSAKVVVESEIGKGSCFSVHLLKGTAHFGNNVEIIHAVKTAEIVNENSIPDSNEIIEPAQTDDQRPKVLVVEDDTELRSFLRSILELDYIIYEAADGIEGFELAIAQNPDFIVSDIMMPRMNGIELLKNLRADLNTSHIPIVLLSAKTDIETKLEGLSYGADDYISKPFSVPYFKTRISNLISQRKRLQEIFNESHSLTSNEYNPKPFLITSRDEEIMESLMKIIEENMDNGNFTVEELANYVGLGRTTLFNKLKSLTGLSPVEFIRDIRIKRAAQLLSESQLLVKEVSFMTGFSDTKYFGKCFKAKYGVTPLEYRKG